MHMYRLSMKLRPSVAPSFIIVGTIKTRLPKRMTPSILNSRPIAVRFTSERVSGRCAGMLVMALSQQAPRRKARNDADERSTPDTMILIATATTTTP